MDKKVTLFIIYRGNEKVASVALALSKDPLLHSITLIKPEEKPDTFITGNLLSTGIVKQIAEQTKTKYALVLVEDCEIKPDKNFLSKLTSVAEETSAGLVYSNFYELKRAKEIQHPVIDYQAGSVRDDFDFGPFALIDSIALKNAARNLSEFKFAGFYSLRLAISRHHSIQKINEFLYTIKKTEDKKSGEKQFDYVDPKNREVQIEMEKAFTEHLKKINAYLKPEFSKIDFNNAEFKTEASVIIPVKNREKTIADAVNSVLNQKTNFNYNVIVIDNHSSDKTTGILKTISKQNKKLIHIIPRKKNLRIGGCWNEGISNKNCGKFSVQLDSDDLYKNENTLQKIVDKFHDEKCGMVIGSYNLTDFNLKEIPPGIVDHKEWTDENGRNNALRINGLGAPRAFYTPLIREIKFPDVSYGEDYAVALAISRNYKIGRIYDPVYICRRWEGNTDSSLTIQQQNKNNYYKDGIRTKEIIERQKIISL